jgi:Sugar-transfer associated ATP-grasp
MFNQKLGFSARLREHIKFSKVKLLNFSGTQKPLARVITFPSPHIFFRSRKQKSGNFLQDAYVEAIWKNRSFYSKIFLYLSLLLWPIVFLVQSTWLTSKNGRIVSKRHGISISKQLRGQLNAAWNHGLLPQSYYAFDMFLQPPNIAGSGYHMRDELKGFVFSNMLAPQMQRKLFSANNKLKFRTLCRAANLPTPAEHLVLKPTTNIKTVSLPKTDIFIKLHNAMRGIGAECWKYNGDHRYYSDQHSLFASETEILSRLHSDQQTFIIQERLYNANEIADLSSGALCSIRVITMINERDEIEVTDAVLRMGRGNNVTTDHVCNGGIMAPISLQTGKLGQASDSGVNAALGWIDHHPDTGGQISGRQVPNWQEVVELCLKAHESYRPRRLIGWDVALTSRGTMLIESNATPSMDMVQRCSRKTFGSSRLLQLFEYHVSKTIGFDNKDAITLIGTRL